ncbi:unnamed protein product [Paramecium pentaurelia]|uniref:Uncharacterized protein n=1 Tax=Paramecium pentaurelia TaxID=43138 RepID=A0A8S1WNG5_9CILI|nr:unnamed protein product [Paramecium pentaurelia]
MNSLTQKQEQEASETICKSHNQELIAVDLNLSDKAQIQFFCGKCLVEKINNSQITTIEQSKERIQQIKIQQKDIKSKENQARLNYYKNILDQIMDFKQSIDDSLEKMYKQIQQYIFPIQKEKQELQEYEQQLNYFEDIKQLSELYSQEQQKSPKLIEDNHFINEIQRQFELLFNSSEYFQTLDTFKITKEKIKDIMENNVIQLIPQFIIKNDSKTPSLSRICSNHKKEIIMIDMESQDKKIEDRFVCVDCISENPNTKYQTIENVDKQWKEYYTETDRILKEYKNDGKKKKSELFNQIALMRKNYNKKLDEISDKLISEQFLCMDKTKQSNQIKNISLQALGDEQLLKDLKQLIDKDKEKVSQSQIITNQINKDSIFKKDIQYHLESLQQYDQQDIQASLDIIKDISIEKSLINQLTDMIQEILKCSQKDENYKNQINFIKDIQELIDQAKKYQCQLNLFYQTITVYQQLVQNIEKNLQNIQLKQQDQTVKSEQLKSQYSKLLNILNEYANTFDNHSIELKKYSSIKQLENSIKQLENDVIKLTESNKNLETEKNNLVNSMQESFNQKFNEINQTLEQKQKEQKNMKEQYEQTIKDNKKQYEQEKQEMMNKFEDEQNNIKQEFNQNLSQKISELQETLTKLEQINKVKLEQEKLNKNRIRKSIFIINLLNYIQIQLFSKSLSFSDTYRHNYCQLSVDGKVLADTSNNGYHYYCHCEQAIPKTGKTQFAFQMISGSYVMVGIGFREIMQKNNYTSCYQTGTYLISNSGITYSHHNNDLQSKQVSFKFKNNDIIIIEVCIEHKYIKWSRLNNPQLTFIVQLDIDTSKELYPCVGVGWESKIKLLDNIPIQS